MNEFLKYIKTLKQKGFATADEKAKVHAQHKELDDDEKDTVQDDVNAVDELPEEDPNAGGEGDEEDDEEVGKQVRELVTSHAKSASEAVLTEAKQSIEDMKAEVQKWLKEQEQLKEKKAGIYHPEAQEDRKEVNEYLRNFLSAAFDGDVDTISKLNNVSSKKELTTDDQGSPFGGYAVDEQLSAEIRHLTTEYGVARREFTNVQLSKNSYKANTLATDVSVYWVDEGNTIKSTQAVLGQDSLELKKLAAIVTMTRELLEDQEIDLFSFVATRVAEGFAQAEDKAAFIGDGTATYGSFTGLLNVSGTNETTMATGNTAFTDMTADDLLDMQDDTPAGALPNAKYYMHRSIMNIVRKLKDDQSMPIFQAVSVAGPATIWGRPVVTVEVMPSVTDSAAATSFVLFGDLRKSSIFGFKGTIAADRFDAGVVRNVADDGDINLITTDREAVRWVERIGTLHLLPSAVTKLTTAAT